MHSIIKSIIKFKSKINQSKKEPNEQIIHSKYQFNYSINNNELQKNKKNNRKTTRKCKFIYSIVTMNDYYYYYYYSIN